MRAIQVNRSSKRRWVFVATFLAIIAAGGGSYWFWPQGQSPSSSRVAARAAIPVTVAIAARRDVPIYVSGLGTVQASNTVKIASQVDGKLERVLFTEGQHVEKGDLLAKIDPRPYQAALDQAKAKKDQDAALLLVEWSAWLLPLRAEQELPGSIGPTNRPPWLGTAVQARAPPIA